jgi:hypothetical protein
MRLLNWLGFQKLFIARDVPIASQNYSINPANYGFNPFELCQIDGLPGRFWA